MFIVLLLKGYWRGIYPNKPFRAKSSFYRLQLHFPLFSLNCLLCGLKASSSVPSGNRISFSHLYLRCFSEFFKPYINPAEWEYQTCTNHVECGQDLDLPSSALPFLLQPFPDNFSHFTCCLDSWSAPSRCFHSTVTTPSSHTWMVMVSSESVMLYRQVALIFYLMCLWGSPASHWVLWEVHKGHSTGFFLSPNNVVLSSYFVSSLLFPTLLRIKLNMGWEERPWSRENTRMVQRSPHSFCIWTRSPQNSWWPWNCLPCLYYAERGGNA